MNSEATISDALEESAAVLRATREHALEEIARAAAWTVDTLRGGGKLLLLGNGGSAADCQHIAAELVGRFEKRRRPLPAIALTTDTSALTAIANDFGVESIFARQVAALGSQGDLVFALSTSGESANVLAAVDAARRAGIRSVALTGRSGGALATRCELAIRVASDRVSRIQEAHIAVCHALCEVVELDLCR